MRRAEPTSGNVDMRETKAGGLGEVAVVVSDDEGEEVEAYEVAESAGGAREPTTRIDDDKFVINETTHCGRRCCAYRREPLPRF